MIYTPRVCIDALFHPVVLGLKNKQVCTKVEFKGFEISIAMDSSHGDGDLKRTDIRVYSITKGKDISELFYVDGETMLYGDAETLLRVMKQIEVMTA